VRIHESVSRCVHLITCRESTKEPDTYSVERKLRVPIDKSCYGDVTTS